MACGCNKGAASRGRTPMIRPISSARSTRGGIAAAKTPTEVRNQSMNPPSNMNSGGVSAERRRTQALRREAISKSLNK